MFDQYTMRARQVVMAARLKAGQRGAGAIETDDLLAALVIEDQGDFPKMMFELRGHPISAIRVDPQSHSPFLDPALASSLLARIEALLPRSQPVPTAQDMPLSEGVKHAFEAAAALKDELKQTRVGPLHLLAAAVGDEISQGARIFREAGITPGSVLQGIREESG
ncbi:MAG TPA: Clp protease N-terminal domain-containing protein [Terriglobia bacterium]|nr:Clp protease N-terminal domain-containing protein [Terriglobia bacterium]